MDIITRQQALEQGLRWYFTGKPCSEGGLGLRLTSNGRCYCDLCTTKIKTQKSVDYQVHRNQRDLTSSLWKQRNPDRVKTAEKESRKRCRDLKKKGDKTTKNRLEGTYYERNKEKIKAKRQTPEIRNQRLAAKRKYKANNKDKIRAESSTRRARRKQAVPTWFGEFDQFVLGEATSLCVQREHETGMEWHVDHVIPLCAKTASGLHCAENVQVIPAKINLVKGNKLIYTDRIEWLK